MNKLSKDDEARRAALIEQLNKAHGELTAAVDDFNEVILDGWGRVEDAQNVYNALVSEAQEWTTDIGSQIDDYVMVEAENAADILDQLPTEVAA